MTAVAERVSARDLNAAVERAVARAEKELLDRLAAAYAKVIRRVGRQAAAAYRDRSSVVASARHDELYDPDALRRMAERETRRLRRAAVEIVIGDVLTDLAVAFNVAPLVVDSLTAHIGIRARDLDRAMMRVLRSTIEEASQAGWTVPETSKAIVENVGGMATSTATALARTDLIGLANGGSITAAREVLGDGATKTWLSAEDDRVRPSHADADGQTVPVDGAFQVGDDLLDYPGDPNGSDEEVINCRCTVIFNETPIAASGLTEEGTMATTTDETAANGQSTTGGVTTVSFNQADGSVTITGLTTMNTGSGSGVLAARPGSMAAADAAAEDAPQWEAVLAVEGEQTEDFRIIDPGALTWRDLPLTLMGMDSTSAMGGHDGAVAVGRIDTIRRDGADIVATGVWANDENGVRFAELVGEQIVRGVSVDLAILDYEIRDPETGDVMTDEQIMEAMFTGAPVLYAITDAVIGMATVCPFQAIEGADIEIVASGARGTVIVASAFGCDECREIEVVTASAALMAPDAPPAEWFDDPGLTALTPLTVTDDGRVYGHLADWNVCHTGSANACILPPRGCDYSFFHAGLLRTSDGRDVRVGQITMDAVHPSTDPRIGAAAARNHYDDTGIAIADVAIGEDAFGPWIAGAIRPDADAAKVRALRAGGKVSGDWRVVNGRYALVAALAVNVPGFPIPRAQATLDERGEPIALVASGIVVDESTTAAVDDDAARRARIRALAARAEGGVEALARLAG